MKEVTVLPHDASTSSDSSAHGAPPKVSIRRDADALIVGATGRWRLGEATPASTDIGEELDSSPPARIAFDVRALETWDSRFVAFVARVHRVASVRGIRVESDTLPPQIQRLLRLAQAVSAKPSQRSEPKRGFFEGIGRNTLIRGQSVQDVLTFIGEMTTSLGRLVRGRAHFRSSEMLLQMEIAGARALGIVGLVNFLVGVILAFVGAVQLETFGASLYVADLVGVAMVRELAAVMTGIVLSGRTGAAFAAELGTMRVTQEVDALSTLGIQPIEFLVLPRIIAVTLMMPLLCLYADFVGVLGGALIGVSMLDIAPRTYWQETVGALSFATLFGGVFKASVYGLLLASAGCFEGLRSGRSGSTSPSCKKPRGTSESPS